MASALTAIDLSQLTAPDVVETVDFETILAGMLADLRARDTVFSALVESDPAYKVLEVAAYREAVLRQRVNDAARAVMLAFALGADLDQIAALYGVKRLVTSAENPDAVPPVPPTYETDAALRARVQLAVEGFSVAGPIGAYQFHALSADGDVKDVAVESPTPGDVLVTVLSRTGDGTVSAELVATVLAALNADSVRPLCDEVSVQGATIQNYTIEATLYFYPGPDRAQVLAAANAAAAAYATAQHAIGRDITLSGLYAALHQPGVQRVELAAPASSLTINSTTAAYCTDITLTDGGVDE